MNVLVTGALGFVGSHLVQGLRDRHRVFALVRRLPQDRSGGVSWIGQDLTRPLDLGLLPAKIDAVVHLAQSKHYKQFPDGATDIFDVNVRSTLNLLEYARGAGARSFVLASTGGLYGYSFEKFVETDPINLGNFYVTSKYAAELLVGNYSPYFTTVVLRLFFVYGPGQRGMLIPNLLGKVLQDETITIEGNPGCRINPLHIDDAVRVFEPAMRLPHSALLNVAGNEIVSLTDLVRAMETATGRKAALRYSEASQPGDLIADNSRMATMLGVEPRLSLIQGLIGMIGAEAR